MAEVAINVNGQTYKVTCDEGQEKHLLGLAQFLDERVGKLVESFGQVGEARLLLMAGLLTADEFSEAQHEIETLRAELEQISAARDKLGGEASDAWQAILTQASRRLEDIATRLEKA